MPLYRLTAEIEIVMYAEDWSEAEDGARDCMRDAIRDDPGEFQLTGPHEVKVGGYLGEWHNSRPYNRDGDDLTCTQILAMEAEAEKRRPPTVEEIEAAGQVRLIP